MNTNNFYVVFCDDKICPPQIFNIEKDNIKDISAYFDVLTDFINWRDRRTGKNKLFTSYECGVEDEDFLEWAQTCDKIYCVPLEKYLEQLTTDDTIRKDFNVAMRRDFFKYYCRNLMPEFFGNYEAALRWVYPRNLKIEAYQF